MLYSLEVPPAGGNTRSADVRHLRVAAGAPEGPHRRTEDQARRHLQQRRLRAPGRHPTDDPRTSPGAVHLLVCTHPDTGRRMLYLGRRRNAWLVGLDLADSEALLDELWASSIGRNLSGSNVWRVGDLVLWDNRVPCTGAMPLTRTAADHAPHPGQGRREASLMRWFPRHARACRGHPRLSCEPSVKDVDGRDKPGTTPSKWFTRRHDATLRFRRRKGVACGRAHSLVDEPLEAPAIEILAT